MKVAPSSQTLILGSAPRGTRDVPHPVDATPKTLAAGPALQRLTIVAAQPDATLLYVRADYGDAGEDVGIYSGTPVQRIPRAAATVIDGQGARPALPGVRQDYSGISAHLNPVQLYARTQGILVETSPFGEVDVHA